MGNILYTHTQIKLDEIIETTKKDISNSYDLSDPEQIKLANVELMNCFSHLSKRDKLYLRSKLF